MEERAVFHLGNCEVKQFIPTTCSSVLEEIMKKRTYPCGAFFFLFCEEQQNELYLKWEEVVWGESGKFAFGANLAQHYT